MRPSTARSVGLVVGFAADRLLGDPRTHHPVSGFGRAAAVLERHTYADSRVAGGLHTALLVATPVALGVLADRWTRNRPTLRLVATGLATWTVLGGRTLEREALAVAAAVGDDVEAGRRQVARLVGRDTASLDTGQVCRAAVESVAENTSDAVVAPLCAGAFGGVGGLLGYRALNTLDAMIGHRSTRYARFGWAAARLDDLANLVPARLSGVLAVGSAPVVGGTPAAARDAWRAHARHHPSPNGGVVEAAFAGALGVTLGGVNTYGGRADDRGTLGWGPLPEPADIARATRLARLIGWAATALAALSAAARASPAPPARR